MSHQCPECGTPKGPDGSPACDCNQRTADALRDARTAEQAAAEDFDPLRIRPYVAIEADAAADAGAETAPVPVVAEPTVPVVAEPTGPVVAEPTGPVVAEPTGPVRAVAADTADTADAAEAAPARQPRRSPRWALILAVAGAVAAILAVAGFASGLFARVTPTRDGAAPADVRQSVPDVTPSTASPSAASSTSPASSPSPSGPASPSPSHSPSPTPSGSPASPTPSRSATPTASATTAGAAASAQPTTAPVLRPGDTGAEVTELQQRLAQLNLYTGRPDGHYDRTTEDAVRTYQLARGILTDQSGVYGTATRTALESETTKP